MVRISRDAPCFFITAVSKNRLPVFQSDAIKQILCKALDEARQSAGFDIFAYAIMPDHLHVVTDGARKPSDTLRFIKGIASRRILQYLKERHYQSSLDKLRNAGRGDNHQYSVWECHSNVLLLTTETAFMQRVNYIHQNPVEAGLAERTTDYPWSSVRTWGGGLEEEHLSVDIGQISWRSPG